MRVTRVLLFLLYLSSTGGRGVADELPSAATIEAKALAAEGTVPKNYRDTIQGSGTLGDIKQVTYHSGDDERTTADRGGFHDETGTYRGDTWRQDENGLTFLVVKDPDDATSAPPKTTAARVAKPLDAYLVTEVYPSGLERRSYYDPANFHLLRRERWSAGVPIVTTYDEYAVFANRTLPARWTIVRGSESEHYRRDDYTIGNTTDADVRVPGIVRPLVEFPNGTSSVDLPVSVIDNAVYIHANVGGRGLDFQLDTGASGIFIDEGVARSMGLTLTNATSEIAAKAFTGYDTRIPELHIGPLVMHDIVAEAVPMPDRSTQGVKAVGLLGFDFLAELGVTIDYEHGKVRVAPAEKYTPPKSDPDTYTFDLRLGSGVPMVTVSVNGAVADRVMFDTGWTGSLAFFDYFARRYPQQFRLEAGVAVGEGVGGAFASEVYTFRDVKVGRIHFNNFHGMKIPAKNFPLNMDGVIGNTLLSMFTVDLDYMDGRIYLTPNNAGRKTMYTVAPKK